MPSTTKSITSSTASRRDFLRTGLLGMTALPFLGGAPIKIQKNGFDLYEQTITIRGLPDSFKGFRIGMMSDIHSCVFMNKDDMDAYVASMNALKTDLVVVTGDFVNSQTEEVYPLAESFSTLTAPSGVYGCLGNHDFFAKDVERVAREVNDCGIRLLRNDGVPIRRGAGTINLIGVDDIHRTDNANPYLDAAMASSNKDAPTILLCHKPYYFQNANDRGIQLTLSGHTHGGQVVFGVVDKTPIALATLFSPYVAGLYSLHESQMYVNRGIGTVGLPFRINCPPELTVITLA